MPEFTITGLRAGRTVSVTWRDGGRLTSSDDDATAIWVERLAAAYDGTPRRYGMAPATVHDHLRSPYTACGLIRSVFAGRVHQDQPLPALDLPPDAIA